MKYYLSLQFNQFRQLETKELSSLIFYVDETNYLLVFGPNENKSYGNYSYFHMASSLYALKCHLNQL